MFNFTREVDGVTHGGAFFEFLVSLGMDPSTRLFNNVWSTRIIIAFIQFWMWFGNSMLVYISGIKGISDEVYEAADIDGAGSFRVFFSITLPILKPIMLYSLITSLIGGLQMFDIPYLIGDVTFKSGSNVGISGTMTITAYIYNFMKVNEDYSIAASASVILFLVSLALSILMYFMFFKPKDYTKKVMRKLQKYARNE